MFTVAADVYSATITGLPVGEYSVRVFAANTVGDGPVASYSQVFVDGVVDGQPTSFTPGAPAVEGDNLAETGQGIGMIMGIGITLVLSGAMVLLSWRRYLARLV